MEKINFKFNPEKIEYKNLSFDDLNQVFKIENLVHSKPWSENLIKAEFEKEISFRPALYFEKNLIAYSFNHIVETELHVLNLAVAPVYQSTGLGSFLLSRIIEEGRAREISSFYLEVRKSNNKAIKLYTKAGFKTAGIRKNYYSDNNEDAVLMELVL